MSSVSDTLPRTGQQLLQQSSGQHVLLRGVSWSTYEQLCADMQRGSEADSCFYIQHASSVRGKDSIDLAVDPAPDLVIEVDLTHPLLDKMPIYAALGVPELWRYDGTALTIYTLSGATYRPQRTSSALPNIDGQTLTHFVERAQTTKRTEWLAQLRAWLREKP